MKKVLIVINTSKSDSLSLSEKISLYLQDKGFICDCINFDGFCENTGKRTNYNKKGSDEDQKLRVTLIPDQTLKMLLDYIISHGYCDNDFIFQREDGSPLRQEFLESVFHRVIIKAGIDSTNRKLCPHSFRFTYVTRMRTKVNAEVVQKMVGHSSIEMTEYYTRAAIPEMVSSIQNVLPAVNELFE